MKAFFSCSIDKILENKDSYEAIVNTIKKEGISITRDWLAKSIQLAEEKTTEIGRRNFYTDVMNAILEADVTIFDCTVQSMSIGHQLTFALNKGKPTLLLAKESEENIEDLFISGSKSNYLTLKNYKNSSDIPEIVKKFLDAHSGKVKERKKIRFQIVLDEFQHDYIEWASYKHKKNKSEIIKEAINDKSHQDIDFQRYTSSLP